LRKTNINEVKNLCVWVKKIQENKIKLNGQINELRVKKTMI